MYGTIIQQGKNSYVVPFISYGRTIFHNALVLLLLTTFIKIMYFTVDLSCQLGLQCVIPRLFYVMYTVLVFYFLTSNVQVQSFNRGQDGFSNSFYFLPT